MPSTRSAWPRLWLFHVVALPRNGHRSFWAGPRRWRHGAGRLSRLPITRSFGTIAGVLPRGRIRDFVGFDSASSPAKDLPTLPARCLSVANLTNPGIGAVFPFVVVSFIGFERPLSTAKRRISPAGPSPRATFIALGVIMVFYTLSVLGHHRRGRVLAKRKPIATKEAATSSSRCANDLWWRRPCRCDGHLPRSLVPRELSRHSQTQRAAISSHLPMTSSCRSARLDPSRSPRSACRQHRNVHAGSRSGVGPRPRGHRAPYVGIASGMIGDRHDRYHRHADRLGPRVFGFFVKVGRPRNLWSHAHSTARERCPL